MDNTINNSLAFGANLNTTFNYKGRAIKRVSQKFSKLTEKFNGELFIDKAYESNHYEFSYNGTIFVTNKLNSVLESINQKASNKELDSVAEKLKYMLKALSIENQYTQSTAAINQQLIQVKNLLERNKKARLNAEEEGFTKVVEIYDGVIEKYGLTIEALKEKLKVKQDQALKKFDKIKDNCEGLDSYKDFLERMFASKIM